MTGERAVRRASSARRCDTKRKTSPCISKEALRIALTEIQREEARQRSSAKYRQFEISQVSFDDRFAECKLTLVGGALPPPLAYVVIRVPFRLVKLTMPRALPHKSPCPSNGRL